MQAHEIVSAAEWERARVALLQKEKEFTHARDALSEARRALPWEPVAKDYVFDGPSGEETLADLFEGRSQLVVYHFMFAPDWETGCKSCSFWADNFNGIRAHLEQRDVTFIAVSRAPLAKLKTFEQRLGWSFKWVSSGKNDFNYDYHVSFRQEGGTSSRVAYNYALIETRQTDLPGISVFYKDPSGKIFHTYSTFGRGLDMLNTAYNYLDIVPKGRDEDGLPSAQAWVRLRDQYGAR